MKRETAEKAAKWWADQLRGRAKLDNGDDSPTGGMTFVLATLLQDAEKKAQSPERIDAFERELANILEKENDKWFAVGVDYNPDMILQDAADAAGLPLGMSTLPWKTTMWIQSGKVTVSCGYRAEPVELD